MAVTLIAISGVGGALAFYALPVFFLVYGGLSSAFLAFVLDGRPGRHLAITVSLFNGAGLVLALEPMFSGMVVESRWL
ncbi:MAG: hypothetical protein EXQ99_07870 [Alphaproteobacteria bacterium]|nr:hypothetical protein [Alphaproteobacteria bacterium]